MLSDHSPLDCLLFINKTKTYQTILPQQDTVVLTIIHFLPAYPPPPLFICRGAFFLWANLLTILFLPSTSSSNPWNSLCLIFCLGISLVNVKQQGFWITIPWFQILSAFHSINIYSHQGWFQDMRTDFILSSMVFESDVLKWLPWGLGGFACFCLLVQTETYIMSFY